MINNIKIFSNDNIKSMEIKNTIENKLINNGYKITNSNYDLGIAIGGDGAFLRMVTSSNFNSDCYYVGVNVGTLGFAQDVSVEAIDDFVREINLSTFKHEKIGIQEIEIRTKDSISKHFALNEIVVRDKDLTVSKLEVKIDYSLLEEFVGDGLLVATSFGSTAYNYSLGGSIVYNTFHTLQITPIAPMNNKSYRNIVNSVIVPSNKIISLIPKVNKRNLVITIDGANHVYDDVYQIETFIDKKIIKILRMNDYNFTKKIGDKFLR